MPGVLITERLDTKTGDKILAKIDTVSGATQVELDTMKAAQEAIKAFVDTVEPTQEVMQATQAALQGAQAVIQAAQEANKAEVIAAGEARKQAVLEASTQSKAEVIAADAQSKAEVLAAEDASKAEVLAAQVTHKETLKDRMDVSLLLLANDEAVGVPNPVVLFELPQAVYQCISPEPFHFAGGTVELYGGTWNNGEEVVISAEAIIEGHWKEIYRHVIGGKTFIPLEGIVNLAGFDCSGGGVRIRMEQSEEGDGFHSWLHAFVK